MKWGARSFPSAVVSVLATGSFWSWGQSCEACRPLFWSQTEGRNASVARAAFAACSPSASCSPPHLTPAAKESAIRLLELGVRGEKRGEIGEGSTASDENGR